MAPKTEIDPLLVKDHRTANIMMVTGPSASSLNDRRRRRCSRSSIICWALVVVVVVTGILIHVMLQDGLGGRPIIDESVLPDDQNLVEISSEGVYSVHYYKYRSNNNTSSTPTTSSSNTNATTSGALLGSTASSNYTIFAELALTMLPPWYTASRMAMNNVLQDKVMDPSNVKNARRVLLTTRDLLDVFSPVYPTDSLWKKVRTLYKDGYELVGYYQDLDHAHITYDGSLWSKRQNEVLRWKSNFEYFDSRHDIHTFLRDDVDLVGCYDHAESHLFWGELDGALPCGNDVATKSLQKLASVQLNNALDLLQESMSFDTVLDVSKQEIFHDFRKEIRSFLDECDLFEFVLLPDGNAEEKSMIKQSLKTIKMAFKLLGKVNDNWTAFDLYAQRNQRFKEQKQLAKEISTGWDDFKSWSISADLKGSIQFLLDYMNRD
jgi:hypothetical protein